MPAVNPDVVDETPPVTADTPFLPADDTFHTPPDDDPFWTETTWWSFNIPERKIGGWLHAEFHTVRGTATWRVYVWDHRGTAPEDLRYFRMRTDVPITEPSPDLRDITVPGGGFSVRMLRPQRDYRIEYADTGANFALRFTFEGVHDPRRYTPGEPPFMEHAHFDQLGHVTGELVLDGTPIPIDCHSIRDRSWSPRGGPRPPRTPSAGGDAAGSSTSSVIPGHAPASWHSSGSRTATPPASHRSTTAGYCATGVSNAWTNPPAGCATTGTRSPAGAPTWTCIWLMSPAG